MLEWLFGKVKKNTSNRDIASEMLRKEAMERTKSSLDLTRESLLTKIEKSQSKLRMSVETKSDELTIVRIIEGAENFTKILCSIDIKNRCANYNSKGLVVLAGLIHTYYNNEDLKMALYLFANNSISWGEFVQFMHKFSSAINFSDNFYNNALEYIELVLELHDISKEKITYNSNKLTQKTDYDYYSDNTVDYDNLELGESYDDYYDNLSYVDE